MNTISNNMLNRKVKNYNNYSHNEKAFMTFIFSLLIATHSLDVYRIKIGVEIINLSIARLALSILLLYYLLSLVKNLKISVVEISTMIFMSWIFITSLVGGVGLGTYTVMLQYSLLLFLVSYKLTQKATEIEIRQILIGVRMAGIIQISFSLYTMYVFITTGAPPSSLPIGPFAYFIEGRHGDLFEVDGYRLGELTRLAIPYSRPQELGAASCTLIFLLTFIRKTIKSDSKFDKILIISLVTIVFLSGSRSAVLSLIAGVVTYAYLEKKWLLKISIKRLLYITLLLIAISTFLFVGGGVVLSNTIQFLENFERLFDILEGASSEEHLYIRLQAMKIALQHPGHFFIGSGPGHFSASTGIASAHSTLFTFLVDIGFIGVVYFLYINITALYNKKLPDKLKNIGIALLVVISASHFLYNLPTTSIFYISMGVVAGIASRYRSTR